MVVRSRPANGPFPGGQRKRIPTDQLVQQPQLAGFSRGANDTLTSPGPPYVKHNAWQKGEQTETPGRISGTGRLSTGQDFDAYTGWGVRWWDGGGVVPFPLLNHPWFPASLQAWTNKALSRVNPNVPIVSLPNLVYELREFPGMLRDLGRVLLGGSRLSDIPGAHLAWQFGWSPLIRDVDTLMNLASEIEKTRGYFNSGRFRMSLGGTIETHNTDLTFESNFDVYARVSRRYGVSTTVWFEAFWESVDTVPTFPTGSMLNQYSAALGLLPSKAAFWNAIPWSFLIDYFYGVSDYLEATDARVKLNPPTLCIMQQGSAKLKSVELHNLNGSNLTLTPPRYNYSLKRRFVVLNPTARLTFATHPLRGKLPILGSLLTSNALKSYRL